MLRRAASALASAAACRTPTLSAAATSSYRLLTPCKHFFTNASPLARQALQHSVPFVIAGGLACTIAAAQALTPPAALAPPAAPPPPAVANAPLAAEAAKNWPALCVVAALSVSLTVLRVLATRKLGALFELAKSAASLPLRPLLVVLLLRVAEGLARGLQALAWAHASARIEAARLLSAYRAILQTDLGYLDTQQGVEARMAQAASDVDDLTRALETASFKGVRNVTSIVSGTTLLVMTSPQMALMALALVPAATLVFLAAGSAVARSQRSVASHAEAASALALERLGDIRTVRVFAREEFEAEQYSGRLNSVISAKDKHGLLYALHTALLVALPGAGTALFLHYGATLVAGGHLTIGALTTVVPLIVEIATSMGGLSRMHANLMRGSAAAARLDALHSAPCDIEKSVASAQLPQPLQGSVVFDNVTFAYPSRPHTIVLNGFSLALTPGECFALVGASGGGKSTVAALLERMYDPTDGRILIDGVDIRQLDPHALRRCIGHVTQDPVLFSGTIRDNIAYASPSAASDAQVVEAARAANAHGFITALPQGYSTPVGHRGLQLSGGQRQRLSLARVLLSSPVLFVCDEATSAMDSQTELQVSQAMAQAMAGRTSIVIAHRLSTVRNADRIGVIDKGRLVEVGTHAELMAMRGAYFRLVQSGSELRDDAGSGSPPQRRSAAGGGG
jgi:ABC-type multidrug transport system fused ATPase/permease subunit